MPPSIRSRTPYAGSSAGVTGRQKSIGVRNTETVNRIVSPNSRRAKPAGRVKPADERPKGVKEETVERECVGEPVQSPSPSSPAEQSGNQPTDVDPASETGSVLALRIRKRRIRPRGRRTPYAARIVDRRIDNPRFIYPPIEPIPILPSRAIRKPTHRCRSRFRNRVRPRPEDTKAGSTPPRQEDPIRGPDRRSEDR